MINHLAVIMDGNRRWAKNHSLQPWLGHKEGIKPINEVINFCLDNQINYLTLYTFSIENLKRPEIEKHYLFTILIDYAENYFISLTEKNIRVRFIGQRSLFPIELIETIENIETKTASSDGLLINILFCYGGQQELIDVFKNYSKIDSKNTELTYQDIRKLSWLGDCPEPELIIRTGGHKRLSNFMLAHSAYSELYFLDDFWPDMTREHFDNILVEFKNVQRNFGT